MPDKPFFKYPRFWYYSLINLVIGWQLHRLVPDVKTLAAYFGVAFIEIVDYTLYLNNALGGLAITVPSILSIIGFIKRRKLKKGIGK